MKYCNEAEQKFAENLGQDEREVFDMFVSVRSGEMTPAEAFIKVRQFVEELESSTV